jgi:hypothetical protein
MLKRYLQGKNASGLKKLDNAPKWKNEILIG